MRIGAYEIEGELARGGQGVVLRARDPSGTPVALKLLRGTTAEARARFERERQLLATLAEADGFVPLLDAGESPEGVWLVMPLLTGGTLRDKLQQGPLGIEPTIALGLALAQALGRAHALGIVHRDVKPENVLFDAKGAPLVVDLGLAKHFRDGASPALSRTGVFRGTASYVAPEQVENAKAVGPRADVFALGAILFECLAGEPAFAGDSALEVLARVVRGERPALRARRAETPEWLARTVERTLETDPLRRFADGLELARALAAREPRARRGPFLLAGLAVLAAPAAGLLALSRAPAAASRPVAAPTPTTTPGASPTPAPTPRAPTGSSAAVEESLRTAWWKPTAEQAEFARKTAQPVWFENKLGIRAVLIPPGRFLMGSPVGEKGRTGDETPHEVTLTRSFYLARTELTNAQYRSFRPEHDSGDFEGRTLNADDQPVVQVTWNDAQAYAKWLAVQDPGCGARLPTEAEWEYAARAGTTGRYFWGDDEAQAGHFANVHDRRSKAAFTAFDWDSMDADDGFEVSAPVGRFRPNPFGLFDMIGNVVEWCEDRYGRYPGGAVTDPIRATSGDARILRGGSWSSMPRRCRAAYFGRYGPDHLAHDVGVRLAFRGASAPR